MCFSCQQFKPEYFHVWHGGVQSPQGHPGFQVAPGEPDPEVPRGQCWGVEQGLCSQNAAAWLPHAAPPPQVPFPAAPGETSKAGEQIEGRAKHRRSERSVLYGKEAKE